MNDLCVIVPRKNRQMQLTQAHFLALTCAGFPSQSHSHRLIRPVRHHLYYKFTSCNAAICEMIEVHRRQMMLLCALGFDIGFGF